jgi:hypothetical protein
MPELSQNCTPVPAPPPLLLVAARRCRRRRTMIPARDPPIIDPKEFEDFPTFARRSSST